MQIAGCPLFLRRNLFLWTTSFVTGPVPRPEDGNFRVAVLVLGGGSLSAVAVGKLPDWRGKLFRGIDENGTYQELPTRATHDKNKLAGTIMTFCA